MLFELRRIVINIIQRNMDLRRVLRFGQIALVIDEDSELESSPIPLVLKEVSARTASLSHRGWHSGKSAHIHTRQGHMAGQCRRQSCW